MPLSRAEQTDTEGLVEGGKAASCRGALPGPERENKTKICRFSEGGILREQNAAFVRVDADGDCAGKCF